MKCKITRGRGIPHFRLTTACQLIFGFALLLGACRSNNGKIGDVLEQSGDNRSELEAVIQHYSKDKKDSLKLKAANFLITNMPNHYSYKDDNLDKFNKIFDLISRREAVKPFSGNYVFPETDRMWDSIARKTGQLDGYGLNVISDCEVISAKLLIENIDYAFMAWELPWAQHLTFDEFCEYVLPYRFQDEALESWRPTFWKKYAWLKDSMAGSDDPVKACALINNDIKRWFRFNGLFNAYPSAISPGNLLKCKMGKCLDQAAIACYAMRSLGIPVAHEYVPQWADRSMGHDFSSVLTKEKKFIGFLGGELPPGSNEIRNRAPKIFRSMFAQQRNDLLEGEANFEEVPYLLRSLFINDVTNQYIQSSTVKLDFPSDIAKQRPFLYLAVFNDTEWVPVVSGKVNGNSAEFSYIGRNIIYLPVLIADGKMQQASDPFLVRPDGSTQFLKPNLAQRQNLELERKYPLQGYKLNWLKWMGGGVFQGANLPNFADATNLFVIPDSISMRMHKSAISKPGAFRYLRYLFPENSSGSMSEITFYDDQGNDLGINSLKIRPQGIDSVDLESAFDRKFETYIDRTPNYEYNGLWIGLDLQTRRKIQAVGYSPRNDRNGIIKGMRYALFYWSEGWKPLGSKIADQDNSLEFKNVPTNAIFLLRNLTEGKEERLFIYSDDKQKWF
ncbi:transglutaminase-like domain-containing protein [Dyadobacter sp. 22481]|uniref:transglutaminase-like domain-containing protein n=1 Tax=Dyadobacter sp. 22481 TaxID=3453926 RepID=UPI003F83EB8D